MSGHVSHISPAEAKVPISTKQEAFQFRNSAKVCYHDIQRADEEKQTELLRHVTESVGCPFHYTEG